MFYEGVIIRERNQSPAPRLCLGRLHALFCECQKVFCFRSEGVIVSGVAIEIVASALTITASSRRGNEKHSGNHGTYKGICDMFTFFLGVSCQNLHFGVLNKELCRFVTSSLFSFRTIKFTKADKK